MPAKASLTQPWTVASTFWCAGYLLLVTAAQATCPHHVSLIIDQLPVISDILLFGMVFDNNLAEAHINLINTGQS